MNKIVKIFSYTYFIVFIAIHFACSGATTENYSKICKTWLGSDINRLIMSWGTPSNEYTMPNGNKIYTWLWVGGSIVTVNYSRYLDMISADKVTYYCKTEFTADKTGTIIWWHWQGNRCVAEDPDEK